MPNLRELKKHLRSIEMTGQLAGAMKTVAAAKYSRLNGILSNYAGYAKRCSGIREQFGSMLSQAYPCVNPDAPRGIVVIGSNRGLCGGYNIELFNFAEEVLVASSRPWMLFTVGKRAAARFHDSEMPVEREFVLPDVVQYEDCTSLLTCLLDYYRQGEISTVEIIHQNFVNMLTQTPVISPLLPLSAEEKTEFADGVLYVPDRETVLFSAAEVCVNASMYMYLLESAAGAQAATLMAMRSAFDNAEQTAAELESAIGRKRQSEVTASVIETSGGFFEA